MYLAIRVTAFDAEINSSDRTGSTPVELTTTKGGIGGGEDDIAPTKLSVTVPTALPMAMSDDGSVVTATGRKIVKNVLTVRLTKKAVFQRENRILDGHKQTVKYIAGIAI